MKQILPLFFLMIYFGAFAQQQVIVKDSSIYNVNGNISTNASKYNYNDNCQLISLVGNNFQVLFSYYSNGKLYQENTQVLDTNTHMYVNSALQTHIYNNIGVQISFTIYDWVDSINSYILFSKDTGIYDQYNRQIERLDSNSSGFYSKTDYYYYTSDKEIDSEVVAVTYEGNTTITRQKYITVYFDSSERSYQKTTYAYDASNKFIGLNRFINYHNSNNYMSKDSSIEEYAYPPDTTVFTPFIKIVTDSILNNDGTLKELTFEFSNLPADTVYYSGSIFYTYSPCKTILAVTFLNFAGSRDGNNTLLQWQTANETNIKSYTIQRSTNGVNFISVGLVDASGNSNRNNYYIFKDINAFSTTVSKLYYRLTEKDNSGLISYSNIIMLNGNSNNPLVYISPNPVRSVINLYAVSSVENAYITVSDFTGKVLSSSTQNIYAGSHITIPVSNFAKGLYLINIKSNTLQQQLKILKE